MVGYFLLLVVIFVIVFKIMASEDKNQKSQWRACSMMMEQKDKERRMAGPRYSLRHRPGDLRVQGGRGKAEPRFRGKKGVRRIIYYVCTDCNMYHGEKKKPAQCRRCGSTTGSVSGSTTRSFNFVMGVVQKMRKKQEAEQEQQERLAQGGGYRADQPPAAKNLFPPAAAAT